jgi:hypothetical protein
MINDEHGQLPAWAPGRSQRHGSTAQAGNGCRRERIAEGDEAVTDGSEHAYVGFDEFEDVMLALELVAMLAKDVLEMALPECRMPYRARWWWLWAGPMAAARSLRNRNVEIANG